MIIMYGYSGYNGTYYDLAKTLTGAKISASKRGITKVYKRVGYNTFLAAVKTTKGWINEENPIYKEWLRNN